MLPRTDHFYAHMTFKPLSVHKSDTRHAVPQLQRCKAFHQAHAGGAGDDGVGRGSTMLWWSNASGCSCCTVV